MPVHVIVHAAEPVVLRPKGHYAEFGKHSVGSEDAETVADQYHWVEMNAAMKCHHSSDR